MDWLDRVNPQIHIVGSTRQRLTWHDPRRTLHDHELLLFAPGFSGRIAYDGGAAVISGNDWLLLPPGLAHTCGGGGAAAPWRAWVHFDWDYSDGVVPVPLMTYAPSTPAARLLRPAPAWVALPRPAQGRIIGLPGVQDLHGRLEAAWIGGGPGQKIQARGLLLELLARLLAPAGRENRDRRHALALAVRDGLDEIASQPFARSEALRTRLARLGHTADTCARAFHAVFGLTPTRYLAAQRMRQAEELLARGERPAAVARRLGYDDPGYFNRVFRRQGGCSPGRFRTA